MADIMTKLLAVLPFAILSALLALPAPAAADSRPAIATQARPLAPFSAVELSGPFDVLVDVGAPRGVRITGPAADLANVETVVERDTLVVRSRQRNGWHFSFGKRRDSITLIVGAPGIKSLQNAGSGDVELSHFQGDTLLLTASGSGDVRANGVVRDLTLRLQGSGDVDVRRLRPAILRARLDGSGDVRAAGVTRELAVELSGSGEVEATDLRTEAVTATVHGSGSVTLAGSTARLRADLSGSGDVDGKALRVARAVLRSGGPGDIALAEVTETLEADLGGPGSLSTRLDTRDAKLTIGGPADVTLSGRTDHLTAQLSGPGTLDGHALQANGANVTVRGPGSATVNVRGKLETQSGRLASNGQPRVVKVDRRGMHAEDAN
jgi:hypothetical protein